jgi:DNA-binding transcriptional MerR regulator
MALPLIVDTLDDVSEAARGAYVEKDGKFHLDVEVEDTTNLKKALQTERGTRGALEKQIKQWQGLGKTPEEIQELLESQRKAQEESDKKAGNFDAILKQHQDKWAAEKKTLEEQVNAATASEREAVVGERVAGALAKLGATEEGIELLPDRLAGRIKFETVNGKRVLKIMQADGETPMAGSGADGTATIDDLVKEATTKYPSLFKASSGSGGGKEPDVKNPGGSGVSKKSDFKSEKERAAYVNKHGLAAYNALAD